MPRAEFNTTVDVYTNNGSDAPGTFRFSFEARIVPENHIGFLSQPLTGVDFHITWIGPSVSAGVVTFLPPNAVWDLSTPNIIVDQLTGFWFKVAWTDRVVPRFGGTPYRRAHCVLVGP